MQSKLKRKDLVKKVFSGRNRGGCQGLSLLARELLIDDCEMRIENRKLVIARSPRRSNLSRTSFGARIYLGKVDFLCRAPGRTGGPAIAGCRPDPPLPRHRAVAARGRRPTTLDPWKHPKGWTERTAAAAP